MSVYLLSFETSGIKNLSRPIVLRFHKKGLGKTFSRQGNVKAVFGVNGAGKTALMLSVSIFKGLLVNDDYLAIHQRRLDDFLCHATCVYEAKATYAIVDEASNELQKAYRYEVSFGKKENGYRIISEHLYELDETTTGEETILFRCEGGKLLEGAPGIDEAYFVKMKDSLDNLLEKSTLLSLYPTLEKGTLAVGNAAPRFSQGVLSLFLLAYALEISLSDDDLPAEPYAINADYFKSIADDSIPMQQFHENRNAKIDYISKAELASYKEKSKRICAFVHLFKSELLKIDEDVKEVGPNLLAVQRYFCYADYRVSSYLESTGIKNIIALFSYIDHSVKGSIVFIDEMDANFNSVYLTKLLSYLVKYGKGQLCFTSHNTLPMGILQDEKFGIDFLSADHYLASWKKNGNYAAENQYTEGFIPGFAFNLEEEDFLTIFPPEEPNASKTNKAFGEQPQPLESISR